MKFASDAELLQEYRDFGTERPAFRLQIAEGAFLSAHPITWLAPAKFFVCRPTGKAPGKFFTNLRSKLELITLFT